MTVDRDLENAILRNLLRHTTRAYEKQLAELHAEKELAQVTLASIGDGVITTDATAVVTFLNPVAESLTGWSVARSAGRRLIDVVTAVDTTNGLRARLPLDQWLQGEETGFRISGLTLVARHGARCAIEGSVSQIRDRDSRVVGLVIVLRDVSETRLLALQMAHQATHDQLTGLLNRPAFEGRLRQQLESEQLADQPACVCYMDLDQFKVVNDTCGHIAGDELLRRIAAVLMTQVRETDVVVRLGGDEFGILLADCDTAAARVIAERICEAIRSFRFVWEDSVFTITASIGLVPLETGSGGVMEVMSAGDHACYVAKEKGGDRVQVFERDDREVAHRMGEMSLVVRVQRALEDGQFELVAQPIMALEPDPLRRWAFEVLVRMPVNGDQTAYPTEQFIRAAERYGLMPRLDRWVVRRTFEALAHEPGAMRRTVHTCFINLSGATLCDETFVGYVRDLLAATAIPAEVICFEITETAAIASLRTARRLIESLNDLGCRFALDDFGQGMSSFGYLKSLPVSFLKIDGLFINDIAADPLDRAMVESMHQLAGLYNLKSIAEAVSSQPIFDIVRAVGIDYAQGNFIGPPRPLGAILEVAADPSGPQPKVTFEDRESQSVRRS